MPKSNSRRTFTACWTCRRRNVRCDNAKPHCARCRRMRIICEGYENRLVWVHHETGAYTPQQRRTYPCHLTWKGYPSWTIDEVGHLIEHCEDGKCECPIHLAGVASPFSAFLQVGPAGRHSKEQERERKGDPSPVRLSITISSAELLDQASPPPDKTANAVILRSSQGAVGLLPEQQIGAASRSFSTAQRHGSVRVSHSLPQPLIQGWKPEENALFHHYVTHVSLLMIPIDCDRNPWKSTYLSIAVHNLHSNGQRALYHAILAQAAYNLANLKGPEHGVADEACAMRYMGLALQELRHSLSDPSEDYTSVSAALLNITIAEHIFHGSSNGWRSHFRGAMGVVSQYLAQKPWQTSHDAWVITQSFVLCIILTQTVPVCSSASADSTVEVDDGFMHDIMAQPGFGYTIGGTARIIKVVYDIQKLEKRMAATTGKTQGPGDSHDEKLLEEANSIAQQLYQPLHDEIETYICHQMSEDTHALARTRTAVVLHVCLFNSAVKIYFLSIVLRRRPAEVADEVLQVLTNAMVFIEVHGGAVSIWPVFVSAAAAYTPKSLALARQFLQFSRGLGMGTRQSIELVLTHVWEERVQLASVRGCDPGEVFVDWRDVMRRLNVDLLLL